MNDELEMYSSCCIAPPLYDIINQHPTGDSDGDVGYCMCCREYAWFCEIKGLNE